MNQERLEQERVLQLVQSEPSDEDKQLVQHGKRYSLRSKKLPGEHRQPGREEHSNIS